MPVDKFGHTDVGYSQRVIAGGVTLSQVNATFLRTDGINAATGNLDMNGHTIKGLPTTNTATARGDKALSRDQAMDLIMNHDNSPSGDNHLTNKKYVDATKVSKTGDTMTGNLSLSVGSDRVRSMGCRNLSGNRLFIIFLGSSLNKMDCGLAKPITFQSTDGFLFKQGEESIIRIGKAANDRRIDFYQQVLMNHKNITDLGDPVLDQEIYKDLRR